MIISIIILSLIGFGVSLYTYNLEQKVEQQPDYKPACDLSDTVSCTKPIKSKYGKLFFVSNSLVGMLYYCIVAVLAFFDARMLLVLASCGAIVVSVVLAYILYFKIKSFCLLCNALYVVNILIFFLSLRAYGLL